MTVLYMMCACLFGKFWIMWSTTWHTEKSINYNCSSDIIFYTKKSIFVVSSTFMFPSKSVTVYCNLYASHFTKSLACPMSCIGKTHPVFDWISCVLQLVHLIIFNSWNNCSEGCLWKQMQLSLSNIIFIVYIYIIYVVVIITSLLYNLVTTLYMYWGWRVFAPVCTLPLPAANFWSHDNFRTTALINNNKCFHSI